MWKWLTSKTVNRPKSVPVEFERHAKDVIAKRFGSDESSNADIPEPYRTAHKHCFRNRTEVMGSDVCACFYCGKTFSSSQIVEWVEDGEQTAICPYCGIDSVIGSAAGYDLSKVFLDEMNRIYFS